MLGQDLRPRLCFTASTRGPACPHESCLGSSSRQSRLLRQAQLVHFECTFYIKSQRTEVKTCHKSHRTEARHKWSLARAIKIQAALRRSGDEDTGSMSRTLRVKCDVGLRQQRQRRRPRPASLCRCAEAGQCVGRERGRSGQECRKEWHA